MAATPETNPCTDCGVIVAEPDINNHELDEIGDWVCLDCGVTRHEWRMERDSGE